MSYESSVIQDDNLRLGFWPDEFLGDYGRTGWLSAPVDHRRHLVVHHHLLW